MPSSLRPALAAAAAALLLVGCSGGGGAGGGGGTSAGPVEAGAAPVPVRTTEVPPTSTPTPSGDVPPVLVLEGTGLGLLAEDGSVAPLPFASTTPDALRLAVEDTVGPLTAGPLPDCAQGPRTALTAEGLQLLFDADLFAGWTETGAADRLLTTVDGVGLGSTLEELQSALPDVQVAAGAAGGVWSSATGLSGTLTGTDPAAQVTSLSGGQTCAPR
jgi:hypothetical protein